MSEKPCAQNAQLPETEERVLNNGHLGNCAISATLHPTVLPSLKEIELCAQTVITEWLSRFGVGYFISQLVW